VGHVSRPRTLEPPWSKHRSITYVSFAPKALSTNNYNPILAVSFIYLYGNSCYFKPARPHSLQNPRSNITIYQLLTLVLSHDLLKYTLPQLSASILIRSKRKLLNTDKGSFVIISINRNRHFPLSLSPLQSTLQELKIQFWRKKRRESKTKHTTHKSGLERAVLRPLTISTK
jgi:hypothetical protein